MDERQPRPVEERDDPEVASLDQNESTRRPSRAVLLLVVGVVAVAAVAAIALGPSSEPGDPAGLPVGWEGARTDGEPLSAGGGKHVATLVVGAADETCWRGYVVEVVIEGCGSRAFEVTEAPKVFGANVKKVAGDRSALGLALWIGSERLTTQETSAPFGVAAVAGMLSSAER